MANKYWIAMQRLESYRKSWLKINPELDEESGIYILTRNGEDGLRYAYIGQAKRILTRLAEHRTKFQHIDISIRNHGLYNETKNPYGWKVDTVKCPVEELDEKEREYIKKYADLGYQLRNKTAGGQDAGKTGIADNRPSKGYHDGLKQGYKNCLKDVAEFFDKYLDYGIKNSCKTKKGDYSQISVKKINEFAELLKRGRE